MLLPAKSISPRPTATVLRRHPPELIIWLAVEPFLTSIADRIEEGEGEPQALRCGHQPRFRLLYRLIEDAERLEDELVTVAHPCLRTYWELSRLGVQIKKEPTSLYA